MIWDIQKLIKCILKKGGYTNPTNYLKIEQKYFTLVFGEYRTLVTLSDVRMIRQSCQCNLKMVEYFCKVIGIFYTCKNIKIFKNIFIRFASTNIIENQLIP